MAHITWCHIYSIPSIYLSVSAVLPLSITRNVNFRIFAQRLQFCFVQWIALSPLYFRPFIWFILRGNFVFVRAPNNSIRDKKKKEKIYKIPPRVFQLFWSCPSIGFLNSTHCRQWLSGFNGSTFGKNGNIYILFFFHQTLKSRQKIHYAENKRGKLWRHFMKIHKL